MRKPFQGVWNIVRFNWPFYILALGFVFLIYLFRSYADAQFTVIADLMLALIVVPTLISLLVSFYVYDLSGLYKLDWLNDLHHNNAEKIVNINAGFDEVSVLLKNKFKDAEMIACDFYDSSKHTEASIRRARKAYPHYPNTLQISTTELPFKNDSADKIFVILSAHEIRNSKERNAFFSELHRVISPTGKIVVVEHLRDAANFLAYNIGALHFHSKATWLDSFRTARMTVTREIKITPFLTAFFLSKYGTES
jgi:ubiquinone/menaquinone biosynthesis C-methylase UbiE